VDPIVEYAIYLPRSERATMSIMAAIVITDAPVVPTLWIHRSEMSAVKLVWRASPILHAREMKRQTKRMGRRPLISER
jgi:hypothetical protein